MEAIDRFDAFFFFFLDYAVWLLSPRPFLFFALCSVELSEGTEEADLVAERTRE